MGRGGPTFLCAEDMRPQERGECPHPVHNWPLPSGYGAAQDAADSRLARGWSNPKCPDCLLYGWEPGTLSDDDVLVLPPRPHAWRDDLDPTATVCAACGAIDDDEHPDLVPPDCVPPGTFEGLRREDADTIETTVGVRRHPTKHIARAVSAEERVYILHPASCVAANDDLRACPYSWALDTGIAPDAWKNDLDRAVITVINPTTHRLEPTALAASERTPDAH